MRKILKVFVCLSLLIPIFSCSGTDQIESISKDIRSIENYVFVKGRWKRTAGNTTLKKPPRINTVSITCDKNSMTCKEIIAELVTPAEESVFKTKQLFIDETTYKIVDWSNEIIHAKYAAPVADFELRISIKDGLAERRWRETKARGSKTSDPNIYAQWTLE